MIALRYAILWLGLLGVLGLVNWHIYQAQAIVEKGSHILLPLAPVDPRSLLQGDYMQLRFDESVFPPEEKEMDLQSDAEPSVSGRVVMKLDEKGVGQFLRYDDGKSLLEGEHYLAYKFRPKPSYYAWSEPRLRYTSTSFFFQEGHRIYYERAKYAVLAVDPAGNALLVGLADEEGRRIMAPQGGEARTDSNGTQPQP